MTTTSAVRRAVRRAVETATIERSPDSAGEIRATAHFTTNARSEIQRINKSPSGLNQIVAACDEEVMHQAKRGEIDAAFACISLRDDVLTWKPSKRFVLTPDGTMHAEDDLFDE